MATLVADRQAERVPRTIEGTTLTTETARHVDRQQWYILAVLCLSTFMLLLDGTIVNVAIPAIIRDFKTDIASIEWVLNGYLLALAVSLITLGRMADLYGRRLFFAGGTAVFTMASVACGLSPNLETLIVARVLQGLGAAAMLPAAISIATVVFAKERRGMALGIISATSGIALALGPILGGLITEASSWRGIFLMNVPLGILAVVGTVVFLYESTDRDAKRNIDYLGVLTVSVAMFTLTFSLVEGQKLGWTSQTILGLFTLSAIALFGFLLVERGRASALMDLALLRNRTFIAANFTGLVMMFGMLGTLFVLTLFLQVVLGISAVETGLAMTPLALAMMVSAPFAGRLSDRIGSRWLIFTGLIAGAAGLFWLGHLTLETTWPDLMAPMVVIGFGIGIVMAPTTAVVMANAPIEKAGNASGIINTMRQLGSVLGVSILGAALQNQLLTNVTSALSLFPLPLEVKNKIVDGLNGGVQIQSVVSTAGESGPLAAQLRQMFNEQFVASLNQSIIIAALVVLLGAMAALLIENHSSSL